MMIDQPPSDYRREGDTFLIELRLHDPRQLFNSLDPAPFHEKDLDDDAERYIVGAAGEFALNTPLKLVIHLPEANPDGTAGTLPEAVHHYFAYRARIAARELRDTLRRGQLSLLIGVTFLFLCIAGRTLLRHYTAGWLAEIVEEGLLISGWVAMWQPLQIFLYDWWPIRRRRRIFARLAALPIEVRRE